MGSESGETTGPASRSRREQVSSRPWSATDESTRPSESGQSRAIPVVLMASIAVALASLLSGQLLGMTGTLGAPDPPTISQTSTSLEVADDGGLVAKIRHVGGDVAMVENLELVVDATDACGTQARLVDLPTSASGTATVEGTDIFSPGESGQATVQAAPDGEWGAGGAVGLTIDSDRCPVGSGETVAVSVVHEPSGTMVLTEQFTG
jgi:FlaG/FlaF family flagellin (archaellin)